MSYATRDNVLTLCPIKLSPPPSSSSTSSFSFSSSRLIRPPALCGHSATLIPASSGISIGGIKGGGDKVLLFGGATEEKISSDAYLFDCAQNSWTGKLKQKQREREERKCERERD